MPNFRSLLLQLLVAASVLVAANLAVERFARNSIPRQVLREAAAAKGVTDLFLGNSTMAAGLDPAAFDAALPGHVALNLAIGASTPVEHFLLFERQADHAGATVVYGFLDTQLTDAPTGSWKDLIGNRAMSYYVEPEAAIGFYHADDPFGAFLHRLIGHVPLLIERHTIWATVERLRRRLAEIGMPRKETNRFGRAEDFALLEADRDEFVAQCRTATEEKLPLAAPIEAMFRLAHERGSRVVIVEMPMPRAHRGGYYSSAAWTSYRSRLFELVLAAGGDFVDASDWIDDAGFEDHLHLNAGGARRFSALLADRLRASK
jgi:hypothetical protein